ncbi:hypothetical protein GCM10010168_57600 [Actinoplanes ianthinogenes]|uniref:VWA domain containing CoxE-like protein n=1 Tax=Actinoplanes ianthinogenes TaxID=122358 RepID=A0ABN6CLH7_9ACTN|nr:VWA domain-containing protein [Actinoplanes ianthinogenes]BCJ45820.1 hypothetical protein Aiant_64770 [Actinoplanes ianthinogenes]GGR31787.1 hypothetical protein GCM10010168_57600 [Actinoplanes ianthinogenes]
MTGAALPPFLVDLVTRLRRRGLPIGVDDYLALRSALGAGFGVASTADFTELCVALWAKSLDERDLVRTVLAGADLPVWQSGVAAVPPRAAEPPVEIPAGEPRPEPAPETSPQPAPETPARPVVQRLTGMTVPPPSTGEFDSTLAVTPRFPLTAREIAQIWRRLRRPVRQGPPIEVDLEATLDRYGRTGLVQAPVMMPARRNTARLLLLVDRQGSMTPYAAYVDHLIRAIRSAGRLDAITTWYFHNLPGKRVDSALLDQLPDPFSPAVDAVLTRIPPLRTGLVHADPDLTEPVPFARVLEQTAPGTAVAIVSDAGAARGSLRTTRLLGSLSLVKAWYSAHCPVAWINPVPVSRWAGSTAEQLARHVPMSGLTTEGLHRAVDVLRGRPGRTERPL